MSLRKAHSTINTQIFWSILIIACIFVYFWIESSKYAIEISNVHIDGVYQTASAMIRVDHGDVVGRDFFFYLGIGPLYLLYPLFSLLGADVSASIAASHLMVKLSFLITLIVFTRFAFSRRSWPTVIALSVSILALLEYIFVQYGIYFRFPVFTSYLDPGNSLKPLRRFAPVIGALLVCLVFARVEVKHRVIALGFVSGTTAIWSNDYGIPTAAALLIFVLWDAYNRKLPLIHTFGSILVWLTTAILWFLLLLSLITQGSTLAWLEYNFVGVSGDQWWYYRPYLNGRVFELSDLSELFLRDGLTTLTCGIAFSVLSFPTLLTIAIVRKDFYALLLFYIGACLFGGALISELFGHLDNYYWSGTMLWIVFALSKIIGDLFPLQLKNRLAKSSLIKNKVIIKASAVAKRTRLKHYLVNSGFGLVFLISLLKTLSSLHFYNETKVQLASSSYYSERLGGYLDQDTAEYIKYIDQLANKYGLENFKLVEEYYGLASAFLNSKLEVSFDSVIHALGEKSRALYLEELKQANFVVTTNPQFSRWQTWGLSQNWWFYRIILKQFFPLKTFDNVIVWQRKKETNNLVGESRKCHITANDLGFNFDIQPFPQKEMMLELSFDYKIDKSMLKRMLLLVKNNFIEWNNYTSLKIASGRARVPVYLTPDLEEDGIPLYVLPQGNKEHFMQVTGCNIERIVIDHSTVFFDERFLPLDMDRGKVRGGFMLNEPTFIVAGLDEHKRVYRPGVKIQFANGEIREIVQIESYPWLTQMLVEYSGEPLPPAQVGYPNRIYVVE